MPALRRVKKTQVLALGSGPKRVANARKIYGNLSKEKVKKLSRRKLNKLADSKVAHHSPPDERQETPPASAETFTHDAAVLPKAYEDPALLWDNRVLTNLQEAEGSYLPNPNYFEDVQMDIEEWMRNKITGWMLDVCVEQDCEGDVFLTSVNYLDRFLSVVSVDRTQLQLLSTATLFLASKLKDTRPLPAEILIQYTDCSITYQELIAWEELIVTKLKWNLPCITARDFLEQFLVRLPFTKEDQGIFKRRAQTFLSLCYANDFSFSTYRPSMTAAACILTAATKVKGHQWCQERNVSQLMTLLAKVGFNFLQEYQKKVETFSS